MEDLFELEIKFEESINKKAVEKKLESFNEGLKMIEAIKAAFANFKQKPEIKKDNTILKLQNATWFESQQIKKEIKKCHGQQQRRHSVKP